MTGGDMALGGAPSDRLTYEQKKVGIAAFVGNAIEQYDFFGYGTGAALVFPSVFYPNTDVRLATMLAFVTFMVGYIFRPSAPWCSAIWATVSAARRR